MFDRIESDSKESAIVKHSINTLIFRSLKRTHELFLSTQSLAVPSHEESNSLRKACKISSEYSAVRDLPPPNDTVGRISSRTDSVSALGPHKPSELGTDIPFEDIGNRGLFRGSTSMVPVRDNNPIKSTLALKAITTEKVISVMCVRNVS